MSEKSDKAPLQLKRVDYDNAWDLCYEFVGGHVVRIYDTDPRAKVVEKLRRLANAIEKGPR